MTTRIRRYLGMMLVGVMIFQPMAALAAAQKSYLAPASSLQKEPYQLQWSIWIGHFLKAFNDRIRSGALAEDCVASGPKIVISDIPSSALQPDSRPELKDEVIALLVQAVDEYYQGLDSMPDPDNDKAHKLFNQIFARGLAPELRRILSQESEFAQVMSVRDLYELQLVQYFKRHGLYFDMGTRQNNIKGRALFLLMFELHDVEGLEHRIDGTFGAIPIVAREIILGRSLLPAFWPSALPASRDSLAVTDVDTTVYYGSNFRPKALGIWAKRAECARAYQECSASSTAQFVGGKSDREVYLRIENALRHKEYADFFLGLSEDQSDEFVEEFTQRRFPGVRVHELIHVMDNKQKLFEKFKLWDPMVLGGVLESRGALIQMAFGINPFEHFANIFSWHTPEGTYALASRLILAGLDQLLAMDPASIGIPALAAFVRAYGHTGADRDDGQARLGRLMQVIKMNAEQVSLFGKVCWLALNDTVTNMIPPPEISDEVIARAMAHEYGLEYRGIRLERGGYSGRPNLILQTPEAEFVVKRLKVEDEDNARFVVDYERHLLSGGIPIPIVSKYDDDQSIVEDFYVKLRNDRTGTVSFYQLERWVEGKKFSRAEVAASPSLMESMGLLLRKIHDLSRDYHPQFERIRRNWFAKAVGRLTQRDAQWRKNLDGRLSVDEGAIVDASIAQIEEIWTRERLAGLPQQLIPGDLNVGGVLFDEDGKEVLGVIDWDLSRFGNPLEDFFAVLTHPGGDTDGRFAGPYQEDLRKLLDGYGPTVGSIIPYFCLAQVMHFIAKSAERLGDSAYNAEAQMIKIRQDLKVLQNIMALFGTQEDTSLIDNLVGQAL